MAFKLRRSRLKRKKKRLTKEELRKKKIALVKKKLKSAVKKKIKSKKLNNKKQNETISININITNDINTGEPTREPNWSTIDHYASAAGQYRKAVIDNRKY
tara:strand:+ start:259 stop:561 length:303 start_codon:yes stop_codon:yes gene_type:complete